MPLAGFSILSGEYTLSYAEYTQTHVEYGDGWYPCGGECLLWSSPSSTLLSCCPGASHRIQSTTFTCLPAGLFLTFKPGTTKVLLAPRAPAFPPATQVWRVDPVPGIAGQYTIRTVHQKASAPKLLAYSHQCSKNEPFLATQPSASVGVRWTMDEPVELFRTVDRACGVVFQLARYAAGTNTSCAVPATAAKQRSLKLMRIRKEEDLPFESIIWSIKKFATYPVTLQGDVTVCPNWEAQVLTDKNFICTDFGSALAIFNSTIAVGQTGAAYVFSTDGQGKWIRRMLPPAPPDNPYVLRKASYGVALSADIVVVGVPWYYRKKGSKLKRPGKVLLYNLADLGAGPVQLPRPKGSTASFGQIVQISQDFLAVGDAQKIFIYAAKLGSAVPQTTLLVEGLGSFVLWGTTLAATSSNFTLIYEYDGSAWVERARFDAAGLMALWNDTLVISTAKGALAPGQWYPNSVLLKLFQRSAKGEWNMFQEIEEKWPDSSGPYAGTVHHSGPALDSDTLVFGATKVELSMRPVYDITQKTFSYIQADDGRWVRTSDIDTSDAPSGWAPA